MKIGNGDWSPGNELGKIITLYIIVWNNVSGIWVIKFFYTNYDLRFKPLLNLGRRCHATELWMDSLIDSFILILGVTFWIR